MPPISIGQEAILGLQLLMAAVLGGIIGFQREGAHKSAGLRTHILICIGAALFAQISKFGFGPDDSRIAAGIVTGIGFLGAGTIIHPRGGVVIGLTTAASIWTTAAVGMAVGVAMYLVAIVATSLVLAILFLPHPSGRGN